MKHADILFFFFSSVRWTKQLTEILLDRYTSTIEEEIYFNLMHWNNYSLLDISKSPKTKLDCKVTQIIIIKKHLSAVNNEKIHFLKRKIFRIFIIRKCKYFDIILVFSPYEYNILNKMIYRKWINIFDNNKIKKSTKFVIFYKIIKRNELNQVT